MSYKNSQRSVLTIATGKSIYIQMAVNLARSFKWWHKNSEIKFVIATDQRELIPPDLSDIEIVELSPNQYGQGFSTKLHLDKITSAEKILFIDADCLCVGSLESLFDRFAGHSVSVIGGEISQGEWFGDVASVCCQFQVKSLPKFNGGVYYIEKGEMSNQVYTKARELDPLYDKIGLIRLRGKPNDELLMAIAMAIYKQQPIPDDGTILSDPQACQGGVFIDVFRGYSRLINPPAPHPQHQDWYPFEEVSPLLVHFLGYHTDFYPYKREELRLKLVVAKKLPVWLSNILATLLCSIPLLSKRFLINSLRPIYHRFFGIRAVKTSARL